MHLQWYDIQQLSRYPKHIGEKFFTIGTCFAYRFAIRKSVEIDLSLEMNERILIAREI